MDAGQAPFQALERRCVEENIQNNIVAEVDIGDPAIPIEDLRSLIINVNHAIHQWRDLANRRNPTEASEAEPVRIILGTFFALFFAYIVVIEGSFQGAFPSPVALDKESCRLKHTVMHILNIFTLVLAIYGFCVGIDALYNRIVVPICRYPIVRGLCSRVTWATVEPTMALTRDLTISECISGEFKGYNGLLDMTVKSSAFGGYLTDTVLALEDLIMIVKYSNLRNRDPLVEHLEAMQEEGKITRALFHAYVADINAASDLFLASAERTLALLDDVRTNESNMWRLFCSAAGEHLSFQTCKPLLGEVTAAFEHNLLTIESTLTSVARQNDVLVSALNQMEGHLKVVGTLVAEEMRDTQKDIDELLKYLWTMVGGNRARLADFQARVDTLGRVEKERKKILGIILDTGEELISMGVHASTLRRQAMEPLLIDGLPREKAIEALRRGSLNIRIKRRRIQSGMIGATLGSVGQI
ncbi:hypothetical protein BJ138DRAFT_1182006 [Hygrophoropsis aurantiaca]|uniref:Uncharacterized protein n=1 Tax=Hygrophoropsis aurantiaca TaxID=72124 RepID=A0ACB8A3L0_9AGAM|nr:hypothetical protein BJ138DRAFT_1182006 [Hygrophoropsis aurantiaca]